jgi:hypothetical protein
MQGGLGDVENDADPFIERMSAKMTPARETLVTMAKFEFKCCSGINL